VDPTSLHTLAQWAGGRLTQGDPARTIERVCTDSRALQPGDLFVALRGEKFDGHAFVQRASSLSAAAAVVDDSFSDALPDNFAVIRVTDTLSALQTIAGRYRASLPLRVIGITGSSGKTSTKDFTAAVLGEKFRVIKTEGNFNNHIGLPLTMLRATSADEIGVFEMGMNHPGEIAPLVAMAAPEAAIITNIGVAHLEFMGNRAAIAREKGMLAEALTATGTLILNAKDEFSESIARRTAAKAVMTGIGQGDVSATVLETGFDGSRFTVDGEEFHLPTPGLHMIENALLAIATGLAFGVSLRSAAAGLADCRLTKGRLEQKLLHGIHILDDSYNANPDSMRAALLTLTSMPVTGARIAVLGHMGELGSESESGHRAVGKAAAQAKVDLLITVGTEATPIALSARASGLVEVHHVPDTAAAAALLAERAHAGDLVLIKGSRSARMERLLDHPPFLSSNPSTP